MGEGAVAELQKASGSTITAGDFRCLALLCLRRGRRESGWEGHVQRLCNLVTSNVDDVVAWWWEWWATRWRCFRGGTVQRWRRAVAPVSRRGLINCGSGSTMPQQSYHTVHQKQGTPTDSSSGDSGSVSFQPAFLLGQLPVRTTEACQCPRWVQSSDGHRHRPVFGLSERDNLFFALAVLVGEVGTKGIYLIYMTPPRSSRIRKCRTQLKCRQSSAVHSRGYSDGKTST